MIVHELIGLSFAFLSFTVNVSGVFFSICSFCTFLFSSLASNLSDFTK